MFLYGGSKPYPVSAMPRQGKDLGARLCANIAR